MACVEACRDTRCDEVSMKWFRSQDGVALMMTLMVSAIALSVMASLMYIMVSGTRISGLNKRFTTALEAGRGGQAVVLEYIGTRGLPDDEFMNAISFDSSGTSDTCLGDKLNKATVDWESACDSKITINPSDDQTYDFKFELDAYTVYAKIVNTIEGNTSAGGRSQKWVTTGVVTAGGGGAGGGGSIEVVPVPYLYTIELDARKGTRADAEKAKLSVLYQY